MAKFVTYLKSNKVVFPKAGEAARAAREAARINALLDKSADTVDKGVYNFLKSDRGQQFIGAITGNSPYLTKLIEKQFDFFVTMLAADLESYFEQVLSDIKFVSESIDKKDVFMRRLRCAKQQVALLVAVADIVGYWDLEMVTKQLSRFATKSAVVALEYVLCQASQGKTFIGKADHETGLLQTDSGIFILAMGKLGAMELNYSSDIDLIVFFDEEVVASNVTNSAHGFCIEATKQMVALLHDRTSDGYVFRVDLRLRPDPFSTPVAISTDRALDYYESVGQNWERAAMIKALPIAGDIKAGEQFLLDLRPYIWRKYLDFASLQDIHSIKRQISSKKEDIPRDLSGYNIKLGHGGIREIELFVQTQQLIWGGRDTDLRVKPTVMSLEALAKKKKITQQAAEDIAGVYRYLRDLEHRLQMVHDAQTHSVPKSEAAVAEIAAFMGFDGAKSFMADLYQRLVTVQGYYAALFKSEKALDSEGSLVFTGDDDDPETLKTLRKMGYAKAKVISQTVRKWHYGRYRSTRATRAREHLTELMPALLRAFADTVEPDKAFLRLDEFLGRLPTGVQLFALLTAQPQLLKVLASILGSFPYLSENLARKPNLLEYVLFPDFLEPLQTVEHLQSSLKEAYGQARHYEDVLDITRRWLHDRQFRVGVQMIQHKITPREARSYLSDLADAVLAVLLPRVEQEFVESRGAFDGGAFIVVAMGKLGSRECAFDTDLDLIFVHDVADDEAQADGEGHFNASEYYARLSRRFITSFSAMTNEGMLYEVDLRLRPSGNDGPISISLDAFKRYYNEAAWIFEIMSLTKARVIAGINPTKLSQEVQKLIGQVIAKPRDAKKLALDVMQNRGRIYRSHKTDDEWNVKYIRGGLIDIEFVVQYLQLLHVHEYPEIANVSTYHALAAIGGTGLLNEDDAIFLQDTYRFYLDLQTMLRLAYSRDMKRQEITHGMREMFVKALEVEDFSDIEQRLKLAEERVQEIYRNLIETQAMA